MACVNAAGDKMSPMLVAKGKTSASLHGFNTDAAPKGTKWAHQENGWMNDAMGERWFRDVFLEDCGEHRPQLLILDGHSSHESLAIIQLAMEEDIHILSLPPHTTHCLQPLDRSVFGPFNKAYNTECSNFLAENPLHLVNKWTFPALFNAAWETALSHNNIANGFRACGIYPFNPKAVTASMFMPSEPSNVPLLQTDVDTTPLPLPLPLPLPQTHTIATSIDSMVSGLNTDLVDTPIVSPSGDDKPVNISNGLHTEEALRVLELLSSGQYEVVATADDSGIATIPDAILASGDDIMSGIETGPAYTGQSQSPPEEAEPSGTSVWNAAIDALFCLLPPFLELILKHRPEKHEQLIVS